MQSNMKLSIFAGQRPFRTDGHRDDRQLNRASHRQRMRTVSSIVTGTLTFRGGSEPIR